MNRTQAAGRPAVVAPIVQPRSGLAHSLDNIRDTFRMLRRNRAGFMGFCLAVVMIVISFIGPFFVPLDTENHLDKIYAPPSWDLPLGTDYAGRSVVPLVVHGGSQAMAVGLLAATISTLIAVLLGAFSAYIGGRTDAIITAVADVFLTLPLFIVLAVIAAIYKPQTVFFLAVILGLLTWPALLRAVRAQVLSIKERDYIEAARSLGLRPTHIVLNEILPNMAGYIIISFVFSITAAMLLQVNLVALGLGRVLS